MKAAQEFFDTSTVKQSINIINYTKYHVEIEPVQGGQAVYTKDKSQIPKLETADKNDNFVYNGGGFVIPSAQLIEDTDEEQHIKAGLWSLPLLNYDSMSATTMRFLAKDNAGKLQESWTVSLWAPGKSTGTKVAGFVWEAMTFGTRGRTTYKHYAEIWCDKGESLSRNHA